MHLPVLEQFFTEWQQKVCRSYLFLFVFLILDLPLCLLLYLYHLLQPWLGLLPGIFQHHNQLNFSWSWSINSWQYDFGSAFGRHLYLYAIYELLALIAQPAFFSSQTLFASNLQGYLIWIGLHVRRLEDIYTFFSSRASFLYHIVTWLTFIVPI